MDIKLNTSNKYFKFKKKHFSYYSIPLHQKFNQNKLIKLLNVLN